MTTAWLKKFDNKKILLLGYGMEGASTYRTLRRFCPGATLQIMDKNTAGVAKAFTEGDKPYIYPAERYLLPEEDVDYVFKSPGIPLMALEGKIDGARITSQTNEFIGAYREHIIGITGTKGKSTTATFLAMLLKAHGANTVLVGNIGKPAFDYIEEGEEMPIFVYELSSHQLETAKVSPKFATVLNLFEEHLDHYKSYDHYRDAKMNIGRCQQAGDVFVVHESLTGFANGFLGRRMSIGDRHVEAGVADLKDGVALRYGNPLTLDDGVKRQVPGHHNLVNMTVAMLLARLAGYEDAALELATLENFQGIPHRLAKVATVGGVTYYNDSIATIPQATIAAIQAVPNTGSIIIGGMDRGIDYSLLVTYINDHLNYEWFLLPDSGHKLMALLRESDHIHPVANLEEAVFLAAKKTPKGKACLLSPAAASYGFYKNFEARGSAFEAAVKALEED